MSKSISLNYARQLAKNYQENKIGSTLPEDETVAVWFQREDILRLLGIDDTTIEPNGVSGIRIYLGAYGEATSAESSVAKNKITLVLVQTKDEKIEVGNEEETAFLDNIDDSTTPASYSTSGEEVSDKTLNDGQMAPPPFHAVGFGLVNW